MSQSKSTSLIDARILVPALGDAVHAGVARHARRRPGSGVVGALCALGASDTSGLALRTRRADLAHELGAKATLFVAADACAAGRLCNASAGSRARQAGPTDGRAVGVGWADGACRRALGCRSAGFARRADQGVAHAARCVARQAGAGARPLFRRAALGAGTTRRAVRAVRVGWTNCWDLHTLARKESASQYGNQSSYQHLSRSRRTGALEHDAKADAAVAGPAGAGGRAGDAGAVAGALEAFARARDAVRVGRAILACVAVRADGAGRAFGALKVDAGAVDGVAHVAGARGRPGGAVAPVGARDAHVRVARAERLGLALCRSNRAA